MGMMDRIHGQDAWAGQHRRDPGSLVYTVDGQGRVLSVRAARQSATPPAHAAASPAPLGSLLCPLAWEPVQRLLAWGAREGMTAAELLDTCRAATHPTTIRRRRNAR